MRVPLGNNDSRGLSKCTVFGKLKREAVKQRTQSSHIPPCHRHMVIVTTLSVHCFALLHHSAPHHTAPQTSAECCFEFTTRGSFGLFGSALPQPLAPVSHERCTRACLYASPLSVARPSFPHPVSRGSDNSNTCDIWATSPTPVPCPKSMSLARSRTSVVPLVQM